jgi:hypothetical protein
MARLWSYLQRKNQAGFLEFSLIDAIPLILMNNRQKMRNSNRKAVEHLLNLGYDDIWLKPHTRRHDLNYCQGAWYRSLDLWNLFDGICISPSGIITFLQIKTNAWAKADPILKWVARVKGIEVLVINVKHTYRKYEVLLRCYKCTTL